MDLIVQRFVLVATHSYVDVKTHSKVPPNVFAITTCKLNDATEYKDKIIPRCKSMLSSTLESSQIKVVKVGNIVQNFMTMRKEEIIFPQLKKENRNDG